MKKILVLASAIIFVASVNVFSQEQKTTTTTTKPATTKQTTAKPAATTTTTTTTTTTATPQDTKAVQSKEPAKKDDKTRTVIPASELPKAAQDYITKTYQGKKIDQAVKVTDPKGMVMYKVEVGEMILHFDANGKFTGESKETLKETKSETKPTTTTTKTTTTETKTEPAKPIKK
jgi:hypothetical protein